MPQCLHHLIEFIQVRLGRVPSCAWVDERLPAYCDWDLPMHEFSAIELHLSHCPVCTKSYNELAPIVDMLLEQWLSVHMPGFSPAKFAAEIMARIDAYERARGARTATAKQVR